MKIPLALPAATVKRFDVVGLGECSVDLVATTDGFPIPDGKQIVHSFQPMVGGQTATAMVACARQGWRARFVGGIGEDEYGHLILTALEHEHVHVTVKRTARAASRFAIAIVDRQTGRRSILERRDPTAELTPGDVDRQVAASGRVLLVDTTVPDVATAVATWARQEGIPTVVDVDRISAGLDDVLRQVDVLIAAEEFPPAYTGEPHLGRALRKLAARFGAKIVIATLGASGSLALCEGQEIATPAFPIRAVDTTGAGDAFRGGFISAWLEAEKDAILEDILARAHATAALKCLKTGAQTGLPSRQEVSAFVTARAQGRSN